MPSFPKGSPGVITRRQRRLDAEQALKEAYAEVDQRDAGYCWITGRYTQPGAVDARVRCEHHHLKGRNVKPEWVTRPERIITVTAEEHQLIHAGWLIVEGSDARKPIFFHWREDIAPKQRPFEIKARRHAHAEAD